MSPARVIPLHRPSGRPCPPGEGAGAGAEPTGSGRDEVELLRLTLGGQASARESLFRSLLPYVHGLVFRLLPRDPDLEDVIQQCLVAILGHLHRVDQPEQFRAWVRGVCVNVVRSKLRRRRLQRLLGFWSNAAPPDFDSLVSEDAPTDVRAELRAVYRCLERLSPDSRVALVLNRVDGLTLPEIAEHLGLSLSTVKRRLGTAEQELQVELSRHGSKP